MELSADFIKKMNPVNNPKNNPVVIKSMSNHIVKLDKEIQRLKELIPTDESEKDVIAKRIKQASDRKARFEEEVLKRKNDAM